MCFDFHDLNEFIDSQSCSLIFEDFLGFFNVLQDVLAPEYTSTATRTLDFVDFLDVLDCNDSKEFQDSMDF